MRKNEMLTAGQRKAIWATCRKELGWSPDEVHEYIGKESVNDLTRVEASELLKALKKIVGEKERSEIEEWYQECEERFFLPENVDSMQPVSKEQKGKIIYLAAEVFDLNPKRFIGFLRIRYKTDKIAIKRQAQAIIEALKSMASYKKREMAK